MRPTTELFSLNKLYTPFFCYAAYHSVRAKRVVNKENESSFVRLEINGRILIVGNDPSDETRFNRISMTVPPLLSPGNPNVDGQRGDEFLDIENRSEQKNVPRISRSRIDRTLIQEARIINDDKLDNAIAQGNLTCQLISIMCAISLGPKIVD